MTIFYSVTLYSLLLKLLHPLYNPPPTFPLLSPCQDKGAPSENDVPSKPPPILLGGAYSSTFSIPPRVNQTGWAAEKSRKEYCSLNAGKGSTEKSV